jgi:hypothetical protein
MSLNRRGTSLLELIVALSLTVLLAALSWSLLATAAFRLRDRSERMALERALQVAAGAIRAALESAGSDLLATAPDGFVVRRIRGAGVLCGISSSALAVSADTASWRAIRNPVGARDSLLIAALVGPARWISIPLIADARPGRCPDGTPALLLPAVLSAADSADVGPGSPLRVYEPVELRLYLSSGAAWVGARSLPSGEAIQPLAGPFQPFGLQLKFLMATGAPAPGSSVPVMVRVRLGGITERAGGVGIGRGLPSRLDSTEFVVTSRNLP